MHNVDCPRTWVPGVVMGAIGVILVIIGIVWIFSNIPMMIGALRDFSNVQANR